MVNKGCHSRWTNRCSNSWTNKTIPMFSFNFSRMVKSYNHEDILIFSQQYTRLSIFDNDPDSKVHGAHMGPTWVLSAPDGPHVGPMNLAIRGTWTWSPLVQVLASCQIEVKPLVEPSLTYSYKKLQWNLNQDTNIFCQKNVFQNIFCKMVAILFRPHCANNLIPAEHSVMRSKKSMYI